MPCSDGGIPYPPSREELLDRKASAMLCAIATVLAKKGALAATAAEADWTEAGVTIGEFHDWLTLHAQKDLERRAREADQQDRQEKAKAALAKLSPAERAALGLE